jgi:NADPH-dependent ferric siderophore reductase
MDRAFSSLAPAESGAASATPASAARASVAARDLQVTRVRHPLKFRLLQVKRVQALNPHLVRVTLAGEDLAGFTSASFDDHVKVFFPAPGAEKPALPEAGPDGPVFPNGRPLARDFTPRRYDPQAGELDIEFALHEAVGEEPVGARSAADREDYFFSTRKSQI